MVLHYASLPADTARYAATLYSASNLDKSLDDIISTKRKQTPKTRRGSAVRQSSVSRGKGAKSAAVGGISAAAVSNANRRQPPVVFPGRGSAGAGSKIIVSNLPHDVTEPQVKELFATTIGPLRRVAMSYRANGQSTGIVTVEFQRKEDANRAYAQYNSRMIDSKRPLKIEVVVDPARAAPPARPAPATAAGKVARGTKAARGTGKKPTPQARAPKTAEDLDAEMEDYTKQGSAESAAPANGAPATA
ncbi:RNA-binding RNA annealing protein [Malassezia sp. CBS 17886]|nr:RNA-binding RNA annealing protein [Malassezia sp. CBS 17886]